MHAYVQLLLAIWHAWLLVAALLRNIDISILLVNSHHKVRREWLQMQGFLSFRLHARGAEMLSKYSAGSCRVKKMHGQAVGARPDGPPPLHQDPQHQSETVSLSFAVIRCVASAQQSLPCRVVRMVATAMTSALTAAPAQSRAAFRTTARSPVQRASCVRVQAKAQVLNSCAHYVIDSFPATVATGRHLSEASPLRSVAPFRQHQVQHLCGCRISAVSHRLEHPHLSPQRQLSFWLCQVSRR